MKAFINLKYSQLKSLLDAANSANDKHVDFIRRRYKRSSENYDGASCFLKAINIIEERKDRIYVKSEFQLSVNSHAGDKILKELLLKKLLGTSSEIRIDMRKYLQKFSLIGGSIEYKPTNTERIKESPVRNFLMDLELIKYNNKTGLYKINEEYFKAVKVILAQKKLTPEDLAIVLKQKEELGKAAELEVLKYEKKRLAGYPLLIDNIEHIAKKDVGAGYDILSWEKESSNGKPVERYVEVKAVSKEKPEFYWSKNEVEKSKEMRNQYHLYLLPVISKEKFDFKNLEIIPNPIQNVFNNAVGWNKKVETYLFSKASK